MIIEFLGKDEFLVISKDVMIGINYGGVKPSISLRDGDFDFCPKGHKCRNPWEGWLDWKHVSIMIAPRSIVVVDNKTSVGFWQVPPMVHVDMYIGNDLTDADPHKPFQDIRALKKGDHIEPFVGIVYRQENIHKMKVEERWFKLILREEKVVEGRLFDEKRSRIRVGDIVRLINSVDNERYLYVRVKRMRIYSNFREMLEKERVERVLPGLGIDEGVRVYEGYYGLNAGPAVALGLELL